MKRLLLLLLLALPGFAQCTITTFTPNTQIKSAPVNANFASLNVCKPQRFSGTSVPGSITASLLGDFYQNTATGDTYQCFKTSGACTAVAAGNWVKVNGTGGGTGTVTVVGAGNLGSTQCVTGGGTQTIQTPSTNCTVDASGNVSANSVTTTGGGTGVLKLPPVLVSALPTCNGGAEGSRASVSDATATTFLSIVAGTGGNHVPVYCNGTNWVIG